MASKELNVAAHLATIQDEIYFWLDVCVARKEALEAAGVVYQKADGVNEATAAYNDRLIAYLRVESAMRTAEVLQGILEREK